MDGHVLPASFLSVSYQRLLPQTLKKHTAQERCARRTWLATRHNSVCALSQPQRFFT